ncbi:TPA: hypothetical protein ACJ569_004695 [Kluyvera cryocrescens]
MTLQPLMVTLKTRRYRRKLISHSGEWAATTKGIVHYGKYGAHIVPARP